jgi:putative oxidoreductase
LLQSNANAHECAIVGEGVVPTDDVRDGPTSQSSASPSTTLEIGMKRDDVIRIAKAIGPWIPAVLLVLIFAKQGWSKFSDSSGWAVAFRHWGYPDWFRITIGVAELLACALLLSGRGAALGGLLIIAVMLGGSATHLIFDQGRHMTSEIVPIVLATIVVLARRQQLTRRAETRPPHAPS